MTTFECEFTIEVMTNPLFVDPNMAPQYFTREASGKVQETMISVTARVNDLKAWKELSGVVTRVAVPHLSQWVVVAYIQAEHFDLISELPYVFDLSKECCLSVFKTTFPVVAKRV